MMCKKIYYFSLIFCCLFFSKLQAFEWYSEYWQQFLWRAYETERIGVRSFMRIQAGNHWKHTRAIFLSEHLVYKVNKNFVLEIHYSYIHGHPLTSPIWRWQHRLELEANRTFDLPCSCQIITRNRLEFRWREKSKPQPDLRFRHRAMFFLPLTNGTALKAFSCFNEIFYDISRGNFEQDRICPCQLTFDIMDKVDLDVYLLVRMLVENKIWIRSVVVGTQLNF